MCIVAIYSSASQISTKDSAGKAKRCEKMPLLRAEAIHRQLVNHETDVGKIGEHQIAEDNVDLLMHGH